MQPLSRNQRPDLLTSLMNMSLVLPWPREMDLCRSSSNVPPLPALLKLLQNHHVVLTFDKVQNPLRLPCSMTSERPKVVRTCGFNILETRFAPQWRALFHHLNCQRCSEHGVFCAFWHILTWKCASRHNSVHFSSSQLPKVELPKAVWDRQFFYTFDVENVLPATMACTFSSSQLLKMLREWCAFYVFDFEMCFAPQRRAIFHLIWPDGSAPAALASLLFDPPEPQIIVKYSESRLCYLFTHLHLLSSDSFSSLIFFLLLFSSLTLPTSAFSICPYCRKFDF